MSLDKKKRFCLYEQRHREACHVFLDTIDIGPDKQVWEVICRPYKKNRSEAQQALSWIWHKQWSKHFGDSPNEEHTKFKRDYVLPILIREQIIPGLAEAHDAVLLARDLGDPKPLQAFYRMLSDRWLDTNQMAEALTQYEQETAEKGLAFITRGPEYDDAMR